MSRSHRHEDDPNDAYAFSSDDGNDDDDSPLNPQAEALLTRCTTLLAEVESFQTSLRRSRLEKTVELRLFLNQVKAEYQAISGLCLKAPMEGKNHAVSACNLLYLEAVWKAAKSVVGITALCKTFSYSERAPAVAGEKEAEGKKGDRRGRGKGSVTVDVVAQNGLQWLKVSLLTPKRLLYELAKAGWDDPSLSSETDTEICPPSPHLATSSLSLTNMAQHLLLASQQVRVQYLHPQVHFVFPNLDPSQSPEAGEFFTTLTNLGAHVQTPTSFLSPRSVPEIVDELTSPIQRSATTLTQTVNIDTTILLALVSDIANCKEVPAEPRFHPAILAQIEQEKEYGVLEAEMWPVLKGRKLVCCRRARERFEEIVGIMGSDTERERATILLSPLSNKQPNISPEERMARFQALCCHPLPAEGILLPIETVDNAEAALEGEGAYQRVAGKLSDVNRAVILTGWRRGETTVTSNGKVTKMVEALVGEEMGPGVFVLETARSLIGRKKTIEL